MKRFIRSLIKFFIVILTLLCLSWFGLKYYFTQVNIIADQVRSYVLTDIQAHHSLPLTQHFSLYHSQTIDFTGIFNDSRSVSNSEFL